MARPLTRIQLFTRHERLPHKMAADYRLPGADDDDVRQELRIALWEAAGKWDSSRGVPFDLFAREVMRRRMADALTAAKRLKHQVLNDAVRTARDADGEVDVLDFVTSRELEPPELLGQLEELRGLVGAILGLTPMERHAITRFIAGYSCEDKQEDNSLTRARRKLRSSLED